MNRPTYTPNIVEFFLVQVVIYLALWMVYAYLAQLLSIILGMVFLIVLLVSLLIEWIEPSKVPRGYFKWMLAAFLAPVLAAGVHLLGSWLGAF